MKKFLIVFMTGFLLSFSVMAQEVISKYDVDITINTDATLTVEETISVTAEGKRIRRGIYRDLPLSQGVTYTVKSVERNHAIEPFFVERKNGKLRINTGNDNLLPYWGNHVFKLTYTVSNGLEIGKNADRLYWNVTGNAWSFPIYEASARVFLPADVSVLRKEIFIGPQGSRERGLIFDGVFQSPRQLNSGEGMTIDVFFEKGAVSSPSPYKDFPLIATGLGIFVAYLVLTWLLFGRDPAKRPIEPRFDTVKTLSAAQAYYIYTHGKEAKKCLTITLLQAAVNGFIKITEKSSFLLTKEREPETKEEKFLDDNLHFPATLTDNYQPEMLSFFHAYTKYLRQSTTGYFLPNKKFVFIASLLLWGICFYLASYFGAPMLGGLLLFYTPFFCVGIFLLMTVSFIGVFWTLFTLVHFSLMTISFVGQTQNLMLVGVVVLYLIGIFLLLIYNRLIFKPTEKGQEIITHLDEIKAYLKETTDGMPIPSFDITEELLPYAFMFDFEKEWNGKMSTATRSFDYQPDWFAGRPFRYERLSGINKNISSCCIRPSSRSGRSGGGSRGGSCGGGRGGGGGGGR